MEKEGEQAKKPKRSGGSGGPGGSGQLQTKKELMAKIKTLVGDKAGNGSEPEDSGADDSKSEAE